MTSPSRRQYLRIKKEHPDAILFFRMGDFYETFDDDARVASRELEIALTSREMGKGQRVPLAGIPYHALDSYLARLIKRGYKVALCEQVSDPATSKGLVDREVVRVVTPGTVIEPNLLEQKANNYLAAAVVEGDNAGLSYIDITTGDFATAQIPASDLPLELARLTPSELLFPEGEEPPSFEGVPFHTPLDSYAFDLELSRETLLRHFGVASLEAYGCDSLPLAIRAAGAILDYLSTTQKAALAQITGLYTYYPQDFMTLDPQTRRNLELFQGGRWGDTSSSLMSVVDHTRTSMGGRLLRKWLGQPLLYLDELNKRQDAVAWFHRSLLRRERVVSLLAQVSDLERLVNRVIKSGFSPELDEIKRAVSSGQEYIAGLESTERERTGIKSLKVGYNRVFGYYIEVTKSYLSRVPESYARRQTLVGGERFIAPELKEYESIVLNAQERIAELESSLF